VCDTQIACDRPAGSPRNAALMSSRSFKLGQRGLRTGSRTCLTARRRRDSSLSGSLLEPHALDATQERKAWLPRLRDYMGKDIMSLMSVPVFIMARPQRR